VNAEAAEGNEKWGSNAACGPRTRKSGGQLTLWSMDLVVLRALWVNGFLKLEPDIDASKQFSQCSWLKTHSHRMCCGAVPRGTATPSVRCERAFNIISK